MPARDHLRHVIESAIDFAIVVTDRDGIVTDWNAGAEIIFGWASAEASGTSVDRIFTARDRAAGRPREEMSLALAEGRADDERWHLRKDGSEFWASGELMPLRDADGVHRGYVKIVRDRTSQRDAGERLRKTEDRFRTLLASVETAFAVVEVKFDADDRPVDYRFLEANPAFARQSGVDLLGKWVTEFAPDLERFWFETYGHVARTGEPAAFENYASQFERWFDVRAIRVGDPDDRQIAIFFNDVSARKRAEEELRTLNDTLEQQVQERTLELNTLWDASPDLLLVIDFEGRFRRVNPAWTAMLGYAPDELVGHHVNAFVLPEDHAETVEAYSEAAAGGRPRIVNRYRHKDGSFRWISWSAAPAGTMTYATGRDITADKEQALALEATADALRQSQKMEAVGQLTGGVAHDFNNLLTIIRSSVDFLRRPDLAEERRKRYMDAVSDTVDRAAKLTGQLLAFARRQALKPEIIEVGARLRAVADMLDTVTGARVRVVTALPDRPCFIKADLSQFETALVNMAVNARDAMDGEGTLTLRLTCGRAMPPIRGHGGGAGPFAEVALSDTGAGIPEADLARIFEPFFTTKEVGKGTGLGLSQVFGFAKQSGGDVDVHSVVGAGTTFALYLPEVSAEASPDGGGGDRGSGPDGRGLRVLVVEDNVEVGRFATQILEDLGYRTEWATNAEAALALLDADGAGFDVVFSDVVMPGMGGIALAEELRRRRPHLPVVLASGYSHVLAVNGVEGFELLHKPYSADQLSRVLRRAAGGRRG